MKKKLMSKKAALAYLGGIVGKCMYICVYQLIDRGSSAAIEWELELSAIVYQS